MKWYDEATKEIEESDTLSEKELTEIFDKYSDILDLINYLKDNKEVAQKFYNTTKNDKHNLRYFINLRLFKDGIIIDEARKQELERKKSSEFVKDDEGKLQYSLLPKDGLEEIVKVLQYGAKKYGRDNWKLCNDKNRYIDALYRHLEAYRAGEMLDKDTNLHHLAHLACNAIFLLYFSKQDKECDCKYCKEVYKDDTKNS